MEEVMKISVKFTDTLVAEYFIEDDHGNVLLGPIASVEEAREEVERLNSQPASDTWIGKYVIVRCKDAGVHAGFLKSYSGRQAELTKSRRLWYWKAKSGAFLSGVAAYGITEASRIGAPINIILTETCEIIECSAESAETIKKAKIHNV
jgi:hypothetical protein